MEDLIVDSFAGGGGASLGIEMALGRSPDIAINHDAAALAMHQANHPATLHLSKNIWKVDPLDHVRGREVGLAWFSPDCKHFSKAKGGKPVARNIRDLAWVVVLWARRARPRLIILENVEEFRDWGPLVEAEDGRLRPCPLRKGFTFRRWLRELKRLGYRVEHRELRACDYGAPTIRKRLFVIARRDGSPIVWPEPTHGPGRALPWRTAAECIDWSLACPSIFLTREEGRAIGVIRPLAEATMARIARGVMRYVVKAAEPFIVPITHTGDDRVHGIDEPMRTVTTAHRGELALVAPFLAPRHNTSSGHHRARPVDEPIATITEKANCGALVAAFLAQHNGGMVGHDVRDPLSTIVQKGSTQALVAPILSHAYSSNTCGGNGDLRQPVKTVVTAKHHALVSAFLIKYYGADQDPRLEEPLHTVTSRDRFGVVMVHGEPWRIVDIGMRMLTPRELFRAQGFPDSYVIAPGFEGRPLTKTAQIRMCGNSVCPPLARALVEANYGGGAARETEAA